MAIGFFTDKSIQPSETEIKEVLGKAGKYWDEITNLLENSRGCKSESIFYGKNYGWSKRYRRSRTAIASLYPGKNYITVQIILNPVHLEKAKSLPLCTEVLACFDKATLFPEGKWVFIKTADSRIVKDVKRLIELKLSRNK